MGNRELKATLGFAAAALLLGSCGLSAGDGAGGPFALLGPADAPVTVVMFSDFECPFCQRGHDTVLELERRYAGKVRVVYKAYPLDMHSHALLAAMAARPYAAVVALALPQTGGAVLGEQLFDGLLPLAEEYGIAIAGGDTNSWNGPLVISVTALGRVTHRGPLLRSGAR